MEDVFVKKMVVQRLGMPFFVNSPRFQEARALWSFVLWQSSHLISSYHSSLCSPLLFSLSLPLPFLTLPLLPPPFAHLPFAHLSFSHSPFLSLFSLSLCSLPPFAHLPFAHPSLFSPPFFSLLPSPPSLPFLSCLSFDLPFFLPFSLFLPFCPPIVSSPSSPSPSLPSPCPFFRPFTQFSLLCLSLVSLLPSPLCFGLPTVSSLGFSIIRISVIPVIPLLLPFNVVFGSDRRHDTGHGP